MAAVSVAPIFLVIIGVAAAAERATPVQPPMNSLDFAFYTCDEGKAFQIAYDSDTPTSATMTISDKNRQYVLNRKPDAAGAQFTNGAARFWTDGRKVVVEGAAVPLQNCKRKVN